MKTANFNLEGNRNRFPHANSLVIGSQFDFVGSLFTVVSFRKEYIVATREDGVKKSFYDFNFETYVNEGDIKIK